MQNDCSSSTSSQTSTNDLIGEHLLSSSSSSLNPSSNQVDLVSIMTSMTTSDGSSNPSSLSTSSTSSSSLSSLSSSISPQSPHLDLNNDNYHSNTRHYHQLVSSNHKNHHRHHHRTKTSDLKCTCKPNEPKQFNCRVCTRNYPVNVQLSRRNGENYHHNNTPVWPPVPAPQSQSISNTTTTISPTLIALLTLTKPTTNTFIPAPNITLTANFMSKQHQQQQNNTPETTTTKQSQTN